MARPPSAPLDLNLPSPFPPPGRTEKWQGFTVRNDGAEIHVRADDATITSAITHPVGQDFPGGDLDQPEQPLSFWLARRDLLTRAQKMRALPDAELEVFIRWLELAEGADDRARLFRIREGVVTFDEMLLVLRPDVDVAVRGKPDFGGILRSLRFQFSPLFGWLMRAEVEILAARGSDGIQRCAQFPVIFPFAGTESLSEMAVRPISTQERTQFAERGRIFRSAAPGPTLQAYEGFLDQPIGDGMRQVWAQGRVMVDCLGLSQFDPGMDHDIAQRVPSARKSGNMFDEFSFLDDNGEVEPSTSSSITDEQLWMCWTHVPAYSLRAKQWGLVRVDQLRPVEFRHDAFDRLVLDAEVKKTVHDLVKHHGAGFSDLVDDKSGGLVFLLEGEPGLGKTLTAEAVAEVLECPLYAVTVGELGATPEDLEDQLRMVLDLARRWDAVLLLDEADIYLEARDGADIVRNAMVSIFLRLLDYHSGTLFLTTNRAENLDKALASRISVRLHYEAHNVETRALVWKSLLGAAGIDTGFAATFASYPLNGRQIRNVVKLAQTLARAETDRSEVIADDLRRALRLLGPLEPPRRRPDGWVRRIAHWLGAR